MQWTSLESFKRNSENGAISAARLAVYQELAKAQEIYGEAVGALSAHEVCHIIRGPGSRATGTPIRINGITPRFSELEKQGVVKCVGRKICTVTGEKVKAWTIVDARASPYPKRPTAENKSQIIRRLKEENELLRAELETIRSSLDVAQTGG